MISNLGSIMNLQRPKAQFKRKEKAKCMLQVDKKATKCVFRNNKFSVCNNLEQ